ncbi:MULTISPECIES: ABC transporter ATP-binding protein [Bacillus]|uniref:ABC transporter ATP-binding protein n=1 Tax=Bacillus glycinifermentans TaxID=1664069 RepID=A0AAJ4D1H0_9BACI|nr:MULTISPECIES: ABC transporter ATP-binding protein [Bacillus]KKB71612.1 spermidine/putrescine ABC transporter ATP-binding protein [Bacillus sp. TH008]MDU0071809.1 ABC transporter ATP-binding protein [Bacillus sp. IG6]MED8019970.1 ABC transporter ATP-binding protein [Bacillus glycinifermentans]QAT64379.1 ABC transporter ATP-binding protein [Bacillus glycinifermentans]WKB78312.1 ABC transporter ATP-binding protein [Bacillus glycinifermentans]
MIELKNVTKKYGKQFALKDASLSLSPGKIYGMTGPNGSGKSTLLKLIAGLVYPDSGTVSVGNDPAARSMSKSIAYLTELDMFYEPFYVKDAVYFYESQFADFQLDQAFDLLKEMKIDGEQKISKLSKGNRGRLKLALTLARNAPVVLLDEPLSGLDPLVRESIVKGLISYLDLEKQTVIIATHEINEIEQILDEVIVVLNGRIEEKRNVEELREEFGVSLLQWFKTFLKDK